MWWALSPNSSIETNLLAQSSKQWSIRCSYCENYNAGRKEINKAFSEIVVIKTAALFILLPKQWHRPAVTRGLVHKCIKTKA
jgi:hypothetical protein